MCKSIFRPLRASEIECRVGSTYERDGKLSISLLLYKDARCDMNILDETVGPFNWKREHREEKGTMFCRVSVNRNYSDPELPQEWVYKEDAGDESRTEARKGEASDSFKRAAVAFGIGRELYTAPDVWINNVPTKERNGKKVPSERYKVKAIDYLAGSIVYLAIKDSKGVTVYEYGKPLGAMDARARLIALCGVKGYKAREIADKYGLNDKSQDEDYEKAFNELVEG